MIRVHRTRGRHWLALAAGNGKHTEQFARELLAAAHNRGIKVTASGWGGFEE